MVLGEQPPFSGVGYNIAGLPLVFLLTSSNEFHAFSSIPSTANRSVAWVQIRICSDSSCINLWKASTLLLFPSEPGVHKLYWSFGSQLAKNPNSNIIFESWSLCEKLPVLTFRNLLQRSSVVLHWLAVLGRSSQQQTNNLELKLSWCLEQTVQGVLKANYNHKHSRLPL